jgi:DNA polymerase IV
MSVLCCYIPDFLVNLACRHQPDLATRPLALLGPDERICALSPAARAAGVHLALHPRQAQALCPELLLRPLALAACQAEQAAFLSVLATWQLPAEELSWGAAYLDLHTLATDPARVEPLAGDLGRQMRHRLGAYLQPALGWDSGKFTARAAALTTRAGRLRLVAKSEEVSFLSPLPITWLPLPVAALRQLHWLGIRTLGQFAALPPVAVQQRFGPAGRQAQQWAQGRDGRPVQATLPALPDPIEVDLDPPTANLALVVTTTLAALGPTLQMLAAHLQGCRRLRLDLHFAEGSSRTLDLTAVEPLSQPASLHPLLTHHLRTLVWPGELTRLRLALLDVTELSIHQLELFPTEPARPALAELAHQLAGRYGPLFLRAEQSDPTHPIPARRFQLHALP